MRPLTIVACATLALAPWAPAAAQLGQGSDGAALVDAVRKSDGGKVNELLEMHPRGLIDTRDEKGDTALLIAIARRDETWVGFLLNKGASPILAGKGGDTPLIVASRVGFAEAVDWLIGLKAKVDTDNRMGETPLIVAVQQRQLPIVRTLLGAGANPDKTDFAGYSARDYARRDQRARDILQLIEAKKRPAPAKP